MLALFAGALALPVAARAQEPWVALTDDDGAPIQNLRVPSTLDPFSLPGVLWLGPAAPDVTLFEFFDYNCSVCRRIVPEMEALVRATPGLRLGLVHNPILGPGSRPSARIALSILRRAGTRAAYDYHTRLFAGRGEVTEARAVSTAAALGYTRDMLEAAELRADAERALDAQAKLAHGIGFNVTPSYVLQGVALFGHPGPKALGKMIAAAKACDALVCP